MGESYRKYGWEEKNKYSIAQAFESIFSTELDKKPWMLKNAEIWKHQLFWKLNCCYVGVRKNS